MTNFLVRTVLFIVFGFIVLNGFIEIFPFSQNRVVASEIVIRAIIESESQISGKILLIGDSVAYQLDLDQGHSHLWDLTTNQAISMAGQYYLVQNAIENNPGLEKIVLVYHPRSFNNNLDQEWTFNYFCKPFLNVSNYNTWSNSVMEQITKKPYWLVYIPLVRYTSLLGFVDYSDDPISHRAFLSDISFDYLIKIEELTNKFDLEFIIVAPPLSETCTENDIELRMSIEACGLEEVFGYYEESIIYLPDSCFRDTIHIKSEYLDYAYLIAINNIE